MHEEQVRTLLADRRFAVILGLHEHPARFESAVRAISRNMAADPSVALGPETVAEQWYRYLQRLCAHTAAWQGAQRCEAWR
jgi:hypothetical protein